jgi:C1A family cysteine protease
MAHHFGWVPDVPDQRDLVYAAPRAVTKALPKKVDLRKGCPAVYNQGDLGSCTANAIAAAIEFDQIKQKEADRFTPSRLFIYYQERVIEHTVKEDSGAMIRDGVKSVAKTGVPPETDWPYVIGKFTQRPPKKAYSDAPLGKAVQYRRVPQTLAQMRGCLAEGYPFVIGFSVYESFESDAVAKTGKAPMPSKSEKLLGGHAVLVVGYDDTAKRFLVRNSWGTGWAMSGYFTIPYDYYTDSNLADDLWTVRLVA